MEEKRQKPILGKRKENEKVNEGGKEEGEIERKEGIVKRKKEGRNDGNHEPTIIFLQNGHFYKCNSATF